MCCVAGESALFAGGGEGRRGDFSGRGGEVCSEVSLTFAAAGALSASTATSGAGSCVVETATGAGIDETPFSAFVNRNDSQIHGSSRQELNSPGKVASTALAGVLPFIEVYPSRMSATSSSSSSS